MNPYESHVMGATHLSEGNSSKREKRPVGLVPVTTGIADASAHIVDRCEIPDRLIWGPPRAAVFGEILVATLCHVMNEDRLVTAVRRVFNKLTIDMLRGITSEQLCDWLGLDPKETGKRDPSQVSELVRQQFCAIDGRALDDFAQAISASSNERSLHHSFAWLASLPAFRLDPLQKKAALVLQRLYITGYVTEATIAMAIPFAVDKHILRLMLRLGVVCVLDEALRKKVIVRGLLSEDEDEELRKAARSALVAISDMTGIEGPRVNYVLWQFARTCCTREDAVCEPSRQSVLPGIGPFADSSFPCPFREECRARRTNAVSTTLDPIMRGARY